MQSIKSCSLYHSSIALMSLEAITRGSLDHGLSPHPLDEFNHQDFDKGMKGHQDSNMGAVIVYLFLKVQTLFTCIF